MTVYRSAALTASPPSFFAPIEDLRLPIIGWRIVTAIAASTSDSPNKPLDAADPLFPVENLLNASTHLRWSTGPTGADIYLDVTGLSDLTNYVAFAGHNFNGFTITIYGLTSGSPPNLFQIFEPTAITENSPIIFEFVRDAYTQIRVQISGSGVRTAAVMYCGELLRMERGVKVDVEHLPLWMGQKTDVISGYSESGNFLGRLVRNQIFETKFEFSNITHDFFAFDELWIFLKEFVPNNPFFIAWLPKSPQDMDWDAGFVWLITDPVVSQNTVTRRWSMILDTRGYGWR